MDGASEFGGQPAEVQQLTCQLHSAIRRVQYLLQIFAARVGGRYLFQRVMCVTHDHLQEVIELVSDTVSQGPDRFVLLGLPQLFFQAMSLDGMTQRTWNQRAA